MAQYCLHCKWYSADDLAHCSTCGAPFEEEFEEEAEAEATEQRPLFERVGWVLALTAAAVVGGAFVYRRFGTGGNLTAAGAAIANAAEAVKSAAGAFYTWLLGPNGQYKDYVVIALIGTAFIWLVLWLLARLGKAGT